MADWQTRARKIARYLWWLLPLASTAVGAWLLLSLLPPHWSPLEPLDMREAPNLITVWKLERLGYDPSACFAAFAASGLPMRRLPDRQGRRDAP